MPNEEKKKKKEKKEEEKKRKKKKKTAPFGTLSNLGHLVSDILFKCHTSLLLLLLLWA